LSTLFPPLRQVAPPAQKFVDERPLLLNIILKLIILVLLLVSTLPYEVKVKNYS
jgi:hypothetical protein